MSLACGMECVVVLGCMRWVWRRCTYIGPNDNATWTSTTPDEFDPVPHVCRLVLVVYEPDLHNPHFIPTCEFRPNPDWVVKRVTYDVSMTSDRPSHRSVDSGPACGLAWAGCQPIKLGWSRNEGGWSIFWTGCRATKPRWNCSKILELKGLNLSAM